MVNLLDGLSSIFGGFGLNSPESKSENNKKPWYDFSFLEDEEEKSAFETAKKEAKSDTGLQLDDNVSSSYSSPLDTAKVKYGLNQTGYYDGDASTIPNQQMIDGVKEFQKDNGLHVDGMLKPKGETISTMNNKMKDFYATKKYEIGTEKGEKEYIRWQLKQNEKEKMAALAPKPKPKPKQEDNWFSFTPLKKAEDKAETKNIIEVKSLIGEPKRKSLFEKSELQETLSDQLREEKSLNLFESLQKKSVHDYSWLNDKAGKQTNVAESEDKYGIKSVDKAKRSEETSHSLLSFDIKRNESENKTIRNLLETKTKTDYPKPEDIKTHKYSSENNYVLGTLSSKHEALYKYDAIGEDNAGGPSYGAYQIATRTGTMKKYIDYIQNNTAFEKYADKLNNAGGAAAAEAKTQTFQNTWKSLAKDEEFNKSQKQFIVETHLKPLLEKISDKNIINIEKRHPVIKDVLYSLSVQHSGAKKIIDRATSSIKNKYGNQAPYVDDSILIKEIYEQRSKYVKSLPESEYRGDGKITKNEKDNILKNRYPEELKDALNYLK